MLKIRLQRTGRKNEPTFRLVLTDSKNSAKSGRFLEVLGNFDSRKGEKAEFKGERISHWMSVGAQVSDTVHNLLVDKKLISGKKVNKLPKKSAPVVVAEAPALEVKEEVKADEPIMCVFIYRDGQSVLVPVKTGIQDNMYIEIQSGLKEGDEVISAPFGTIRTLLRNRGKVEKVSKEMLSVIEE